MINSYSVGQASALARTSELFQRPNATGEGGQVLPRSQNESVSISDAGRNLLDAEVRQMKAEISSGELVDLRGTEGRMRLGLLALGSDVERWTNKGLVLSEKSLLAAADAFEQGFRRNVDAAGNALAGSSVSLNGHQIIMNSQSVPDWFTREHQEFLSNIDDADRRRAFLDGQTYFSRLD